MPEAACRAVAQVFPGGWNIEPWTNRKQQTVLRDHTLRRHYSTFVRYGVLPCIPTRPRLRPGLNLEYLDLRAWDFTDEDFTGVMLTGTILPCTPPDPPAGCIVPDYVQGAVRLPWGWLVC